MIDKVAQRLVSRLLRGGEHMLGDVPQVVGEAPPLRARRMLPARSAEALAVPLEVGQHRQQALGIRVARRLLHPQ